MNAAVSAGYTRAAQDYDTLASPFYAAGIRRLLPLLRVPPLPAILDVGCGTGVNLIEAARWFGPARALCGVDIAPGMVARARVKTAAAGLPAVFAVADAQRLPFPDQSFDLVLCNSVIHWFDDRLQALREMNRVLRPGGSLALIAASQPGYQEWFQLMDVALRAVLGPGAPSAKIPFVTEPELALLLNASGFLTGHLKRHLQRQPVTNPVTFMRLMRTIAPHWRANLSANVEQAVELVALKLLQSMPFFSCTWSALEVVAMKPGWR